MLRILLGVLIGMSMAAPVALALRIASPPTFQEWNTNTFSQLNDTLLQIWNVFNGRYQLDVTTTDPDGSRRGQKGESVLYDPGASEEFCICVDSSTSDWDCSVLTP